jgi:hypothetical protein
MNRKLLSISSIFVTSMAFILPFHNAAQTQEYPGCYAIRPSGRFVDLDNLCEDEPENQTSQAQATRSEECDAFLAVIEENNRLDVAQTTVQQDTSNSAQTTVEQNTLNGADSAQTTVEQDRSGQANFTPETQLQTPNTAASRNAQFQSDIDSITTGLNSFNQDLASLELEDPELIQYRSSLVANNQTIGNSLDTFARDAIAQNQPERLPEADILQTEVNAVTEDTIAEIEAYCLDFNADPQSLESNSE